ncbi:MAG: SRPBCC domain-containing protein [Burkholderiales bacterium]|nr:SRPBCC domain-containing protein [Burkholderiales bacterium]
MRSLLCLVLLAAPPAWAQAKVINESITIKASPAAVYKAWTTRDGIRTFFAPDAVIEPRVGGLFEIHMNPYAEPGMKGADDMRYLALQENRMVSFTWNAPPSLPEARKQRTYVTLRFESHGDDTQVTLFHGGFGEGGEWDKTHAYFSRAWPGVLKNLKKSFEEKPIDWDPWLKQMKAGTEAAKSKADEGKSN